MNYNSEQPIFPNCRRFLFYSSSDKNHRIELIDNLLENTEARQNHQPVLTTPLQSLHRVHLQLNGDQRLMDSQQSWPVVVLLVIL